MERKVAIESITKSEFERWVEEEITNEDWETIADEIEGRVANYLDELLANLMEDFREGLL